MNINREELIRAAELSNQPGPPQWSYEALDTKLARETKAGALLQLCLYSELLTGAHPLSLGTHLG
jgi:uncharacterized protein